jgi:hypothetical protein
MGGHASERLSWKEPLHSLSVELQTDYGLSVVNSRALVLRIGEFLESFVFDEPGSRQYGQICYSAVAIGEKAGKPIRYCLTVPTKLTLLHPEDAKVLQEAGSTALRHARLSRLCAEAVRQGSALSHEDLSLLLAVELSTVRRMVRACAAEGGRPPTRGLVDDIGPTVSHKERVIDLYFRGVLPNQIAARTGHSLGSVERYLSDFARVAELARRGLSVEATTRITGLSAPLVRRYLSLVEEWNQPANRFVFERLLCRFAPIEAASEEEGRDGKR